VKIRIWWPYFFLLFDFILIDFSCAQGDPTTCGWIRSEEQYAAWYVNQQKQRHMQVQSPLHSASRDVLGDLKQQVYEMKQMLDNVVEDLRSVKSQIGDKQDLGNKKKMQIVLDVYVAVGVLCWCGNRHSCSKENKPNSTSHLSTRPFV